MSDIDRTNVITVHMGLTVLIVVKNALNIFIFPKELHLTENMIASE